MDSPGKAKCLFIIALLIWTELLACLDTELLQEDWKAESFLIDSFVGIYTTI